MDCSLPGSSVHGILQARILEWVATTLFRLVITFLPRSKCLLISWLQSLSAVILELKKIESVTVSTFSPSICPEVMGPDAMVLAFWMLSFQPAFSLSSFMLIKRLFNSSLLSAIRVKPDVVDISEHVLIFFLAILIPTCNSSSPAFYMMCSANKLNKQVTINTLVTLRSQSWTSQ